MENYSEMLIVNKRSTDKMLGTFVPPAGQRGVFPVTCCSGDADIDESAKGHVTYAADVCLNCKTRAPQATRLVRGNVSPQWLNRSGLRPRGYGCGPKKTMQAARSKIQNIDASRAT